jgi:RecJ-like exonuclease
MIRPLVDEEKLQKLEEMEVCDLRPEFVEQVVNLRKKVLNKIPIKKMHGVPMDGSTWISLAQQYIQAFNENRVPNVENSWHYICRQKC